LNDILWDLYQVAFNTSACILEQLSSFGIVDDRPDTVEAF
jgi:hypothetical protein